MYHTVVIGAGQSGLAIGYYLRQNNSNFILLEKGVRAGNAWENRYDSLKLFTPRMYSSLPDLSLVGDKHGFPSKDEMASYLQCYAAKFSLPIQFETEITKVTRNNDVFTLTTNKGNIVTKNVVVATGAFHNKYIPPFADKINERVLQLHSSDYKNPTQLREGSVLVVGGGNSGAQIAFELSSVKNTYLAVGNKLSFLPLVVAKRSMYWWLNKLGLTKATKTSFLGKKIQQRGDPIFGLELKKSIKDLEVTLKTRVIDADKDHLIFDDKSCIQVENIVWSTGFTSDFSWLHIPGLLNTEGNVIHKRGVTNVKGLYFLGLPWQYRRGSSLLHGVSEDAKIINDIIYKG